MRGIEKPQMSASRTPTVKPLAAIAAARFTVTELLPTPPLPLATATTRALAGICVSGACSRAFHRALSMTSLRSSALISPHSMFTDRTPGWVATRVSMSLRICPRSGQPPMVSLTPTTTSPSGLTVTDGTIPRSTMSEPSSGSMTPRSSPMIASTVGVVAMDVT